jgi:hypothetical protein
MGMSGIGLVAVAGNPDLSQLLMLIGAALWSGALIKATVAAIKAAKETVS